MSLTNVPSPPGTHKVCPGCSSEIAAADRFCPYCGVESPVNVPPPNVDAATPPMWTPPDRPAGPTQPPAAPWTPPSGTSKPGRRRWIILSIALLLPVAIALGAVASRNKSTPGAGSESPATRTRTLVATLANRAGASNERCSAATDLGGLKTRAAVDGLIASLPDGAVTSCVASALATAGDARAVMPLINVLSHKPTGGTAVSKMFWADDVAHALGTFRDPRAVGVLLTRMAHPSSSEWTTKAMADALVAIAGRGLPRLLPQINSPDPSLRSATLEVLGRIGDRRAEPALVAALAKPDIARDASDVLAKMYANNVAHLLPLLHSKQTLAIAYGLIGLGKPGTEAALVAALMGLGDETLARFYLNCGNNQLEQAAHDWAASHGYVVVPGFGIGSPSWGKL